MADHERMSAGDPHHDHSTCGGTTAVREAQRVTNLMADLLGVGLTSTTRALRFGFANARSGPVDFSRPLEIIRERCASLRVLDLGFATDSPGPGQARFNKQRWLVQLISTTTNCWTGFCGDVLLFVRKKNI